MADGTAILKFTTDRIEPSDLKGTAVILHKEPDNFGNVPSARRNQYQPNDRQPPSDQCHRQCGPPDGLRARQAFTLELMIDSMLPTW